MMKKNEKKYHKLLTKIYIKSFTPRKLLKIVRKNDSFITVVMTTVSRETGKEQIFDFDHPWFFLECGGEDDKNFVLFTPGGTLEGKEGELFIKWQPNRMKDPRYYDIKKIEVFRHLSRSELNELGLK